MKHGILLENTVFNISYKLITLNLSATMCLLLTFHRFLQMFPILFWVSRGISKSHII